MRLVKAKIGYGVKFDPEQQKQLAKAIIFSLYPVEFEEDGTYKSWYYHNLVDVDLFPLHAMASLDEVTPIQIPGIAEALIPRENTVINHKLTTQALSVKQIEQVYEATMGQYLRPQDRANVMKVCRAIESATLEACAQFFDLNDGAVFWGSQAAGYVRDMKDEA